MQFGTFGRAVRRSRKALQAIRIKSFLNAGLGLTRAIKERLQRRAKASTTVFSSKRIVGQALLPQVNYQVRTLHRWR
jgi:hypothetical protein